MLRRFRFAGSRVVKTAVAVFLTAWICEWLNWPPVFAVITAIVTLEPTVSDSIKKGLVRFPASAIGSFYAVLFISLFGNSPITYTLAAVLTIVTCFRLRLHAGLLVATLTAVAMVEVIHSNFLISFFIRLGTTTTGLVVSTIVNMFVLPPDYTQEIIQNIKKASKRTGRFMEKVFRDILDDKREDDTANKQLICQLDQKLNKIDTLIRFQRDESQFHPLVGTDKERFHYAQYHMRQLRLIHYHLDNLIHTPLQTLTWSQAEIQIILEVVTALGQSLQDSSLYDPDEHMEQFNQLIALLWDDNEWVTRKKHPYPTRIPLKLVVLYELLAIYNLVVRYHTGNNQIGMA